MKKKNGFTLVELLVTIALVLSITGIAIASLVSLNKRKQNEAWNQIKEEIETAAKDYFYANEYLYEDLTEDYEATVSVGKLVSEDYLGKITDPRTNKKISDCSVVKYTNKNKKINISFDESSINSAATTCDVSYINTVVKESDAPSIEVKYFKDESCSTEAKTHKATYADGTIKHWFNFNEESLGGTTLYVKVNPASDNKTDIKSISLESNNEEMDSNTYSNTCFPLIKDGENKKYTVTATGVNGRKATIEQTYNKDTVAPTFYHQFSYKIFNVAKKQPDKFTDTNNEYGLFLKENTLTWENKEFKNLKFKKIELKYSVDEKGDLFENINYSIKESEQVSLDRISDDKYVIFYKDFDSAIDIDKISFTFTCKGGDDCHKTINEFNNTGLSLFTEKSSDCSEAKINHNNFIRMKISCDDDGSGCDRFASDKLNCATDGCNKSEIKKDWENEISFAPPEIRDEKGETYYYNPGKYNFAVYDKAGNKTKLTVCSNSNECFIENKN